MLVPIYIYSSTIHSWEDYFMAVAFLSAQRSKDPSSQIGACIVNQDKKIVGIGYNGGSKELLNYWCSSKHSSADVHVYIYLKRTGHTLLYSVYLWCASCR